MFKFEHLMVHKSESENLKTDNNEKFKELSRISNYQRVRVQASNVRKPLILLKKGKKGFKINKKKYLFC